MNGTTLCPHCNTRFKIAEAQLEAHHGMVRCGSCLQAFDARPGFIPDQPSPQLELPILDEPVAPAEELPSDESHVAEAGQAIETAEATGEIELIEKTEATEEAEPPKETTSEEKAASAAGEAMAEEAAPQDSPHDQPLDFNLPAAIEPEIEVPPPATHATDRSAQTLAEQIAFVQDEGEDERVPAPQYRRWPWAIAAFLLLLILLAQAAYFFRVDLAARQPGLKPALTAYCQLLRCSVPLPQKTDLMSIESSDLQADPAHENQIILNALLRNRAPYAQAFPNLELTLNDTLDKPLARRTFKPRDYLPPQENELAGLPPNRELSIKLYLNTAELRPTGYRLALYYPQP